MDMDMDMDMDMVHGHGHGRFWDLARQIPEFEMSDTALFQRCTRASVNTYTSALYYT